MKKSRFTDQQIAHAVAQAEASAVAVMESRQRARCQRMAVARADGSGAVVGRGLVGTAQGADRSQPSALDAFLGDCHFAAQRPPTEATAPAVVGLRDAHRDVEQGLDHGPNATIGVCLLPYPPDRANPRRSGFCRATAKGRWAGTP